MGSYVFIFKDKRPEVLTKEIYLRHIEHLRQSKQTGNLFVAGPIKDQDKILQIVRAEDLTAAQTLIENDPYISSGYYQSFEGYEWFEANESNNWLMDTPRVKEMLKNLR